MSYEYLRGVMGGTPHTTPEPAETIMPPVRPHLSVVPDAPAVFEPEPIEEIPADQWQDKALCAQTDPEAFFPEKGGSTREAKKICLGCEVRTSASSTPWRTTSASVSGAVCPSANVAASSAASSDRRYLISRRSRGR